MDAENEVAKPLWPLVLIFFLEIATAIFWVIPTSYVFIRTLVFPPSAFLISCGVAAIGWYVIWNVGLTIWLLGQRFLDGMEMLRKGVRQGMGLPYSQAERRIISSLMVPRPMFRALIAMFAVLPLAVSLLVWRDCYRPLYRKIGDKVVVLTYRAQLDETIHRIERQGIFKPLPINLDER